MLFPRVIKTCAEALKVSQYFLYEVVLAHEIAHAITHRSRIKTRADLSYNWVGFGQASTESKELLAQLIPFLFFKSQGANGQLDAMEQLAKGQEAKYLAYKAVAPSLKSQTALPKLIIQTRKSQEEEARRDGLFEAEWQIEYNQEDELHTLIKETGRVFAAGTETELTEPMNRQWLPSRVSPATLLQLKDKMEEVAALSRSTNTLGHLSSSGRRRPQTRLSFQFGPDEMFLFSANSNDWGAYDSVFQPFITLIETAIEEAR